VMMEASRDTLDGPVCVINDSDDEVSQTERARNKRRLATNREPQRKKPRREDGEQPRDLIDLTGENEEREDIRTFNTDSNPTSLGGVTQPHFHRALPLGFGGIPRVPIIHLFQHITGAPWNMNHLVDPGHFQENDPVTFEDLSGGYWGRRRKQLAKEERRKGKKFSILNLVDDSESEPDSNEVRSLSTKDMGKHINIPTTTTTTTTMKNGTDFSCEDTQNCNNKKKIELDANDPAHLQSELGNILRQVKCTICLSPLDDLTASVCGHVFCEGCIMQAIKVQGKCPICRRPLTERSIHPLFL